MSSKFSRQIAVMCIAAGTIAVGGELVAYAGYTAAYREVARVEDGAELKVPKAAALVAAGFGVFVHGGGFALDRMALRRAGLSEKDARRRVLGLGTLEYAVLAPATLAAAIVVVTRIPSARTPSIVCGGSFSSLRFRSSASRLSSAPGTPPARAILARSISSFSFSSLGSASRAACSTLPESTNFFCASSYSLAAS